MVKRLLTCVFSVCVASTFFTAPPPALLAQSKPLAIEDLFNFEYIGDPQISPDGTQILYVRRFSDIMTDRRYTNIWLVSFDGTENRPITSGTYNDGSPRWSPDGSQIIFTSDRSGSLQIYKRWMDTGQEAVLTNVQNGPANLSWSPDGKYIAYTAEVESEPLKITSLPAKPRDAEWAEPARVIDRLDYRFNGAGYLTGYNHLFVIHAEGGTPRRITSGDYNHSGTPVWTPDGRYILMSVNRREDRTLEVNDTEIYAFSVEDGSVHQLTDRRGPDNSPAVSPDGTRIAYTGFDDRYQGYQLTKLYVMNRDGSNPQVLQNDIDRSVRNIRWAHDGRGLYFSYDDKGNTKLAYTSLDGKTRLLAHNLDRRGYTVAANGNFAFSYTSTDIPSDVAVGNVRGQDTRLVTAVNEDLLAYRTLGTVEEIWYTSSLDGRDIEGWIIKPPGFDPSNTYPLILKIHGGPFANYGDRFETDMQVMAARGYVILYTNPRGSTSYGEEFGNLIHHAYPGDDFYDLNSGVDAVLTKGYIDEDNLFVTGGSGGGVLTAWMIGRTDRFRAAASHYPVINWYSWTLTADIPMIGIKYWFPGYPWDHVEHYESRSLLSVVKNVKTPTMIITGENDWRTPMSESEQYYTALKVLGIEAVLVRVPGEPHGAANRPSHQISKIEHTMAWFERHKK